MSEVLAELVAYKLGEMRRGNEIGQHPTNYYVWQACIGCGKERWISKSDYENKRRLHCHKCENSSRPCKHRKINTQGYVEVFISPSDFFATMIKQSTHGSYIKEHRLVMAKSLGRCLQPWEQVHHKNGDRQDNRLENLELTTNGAHTIAHNKGYKDGYTKGLIDGRDKQIQELKALVEEQTKLLKEYRNV